MRRISCFVSSSIRVFVLALALILLASTARAYTIVLRGGKIVQIPNTFIVTSTTITYEVSTGFQVTLQLAAIDVPRTDRANGEAPGSFQKRLQKNPIQPVQQPGTNVNSTQERTITNRDLESFARKRVEGELAYERRRKELGLPSAEESRRKSLAESVLTRERFEQNQLEERASEAYWRERAVALKSDIAATDAEINSIRQQLDWLPSNNLAVITGGGSFLGVGRARVNPSLLAPNVPRVFVTPQIGPQVRGSIGGPTRGRVFGGAFRVHGGLRHRLGHSSGFFPGFAAVPYLSNDFYSERIALVTRLNELVARRAGLAARWRALEDEARRAGAMPGWLRP